MLHSCYDLILSGCIKQRNSDQIIPGYLVTFGSINTENIEKNFLFDFY